MSLQIAISGGHRSSTAVVVRDDKAIGCVKSFPLNPHSTPTAQFIARLEDIVERLAAQVGLTVGEFRASTQRRRVAGPPGNRGTNEG